MNCWERLGIAETKEKKQIKRAYSKKLREIDIENSPKVFQELKEAFDLALSLADREAFESAEIKRNEEPAISDLESEIENQQTTLIIEEPELNFQTRFMSFYRQQTYFADLSGWQELLADYEQWDITEYMDNKQLLERFLLDHWSVLAAEIIQFIGKIVGVQEESELGHEDMYFFEQYKKMLTLPSFSFENYKEIPKEQRHAYYYSRFELFGLLNSEESLNGKWYSNLEICNGVNVIDGDLTLLKICFELRHDFRLSKQETKMNIAHLLGQLPKEYKTTGLAFIRYYMIFIQTGVFEQFHYYKRYAPAIVPTPVYQLLMGNVEYNKKNYEAAEGHWRPFFTAYGNQMFLASEKQHFPHYFVPMNTNQSLEPQKATDKIHDYSFLIVSALTISFILLIGSYLSRTAPLPKSTTPSIPSITNTNTFNSGFLKKYQEEKTEKAKIMFTTEVDNSAAVFYYFYLNPKDKDFASFIRGNFTSNGQKVVRESTVTPHQILPGYAERSVDEYFDIQTKFIDGYGNLTYFHMKAFDEPTFILQKNEEGLIENVYGEGWTQLDKEEYTKLYQEIKISPENAARHFANEFLSSFHSEDFLSEGNKLLLSDTIQVMIQQKIDQGYDSIDYELALYSTVSEDQKISYIWVNSVGKNDPYLILSFDEKGRILHIYGESWETMPTEERAEFDNQRQQTKIPIEIK